MTARRRRRAIPSYANSNDTKGGPPYTLTGLTPYTDYNLAIKAFNSGGEGPSSDEISFSTLQASMCSTFEMFIPLQSLNSTFEKQ